MNPGTHLFAAAVPAEAKLVRFIIDRSRLASQALHMEWSIDAVCAEGLAHLGGASVSLDKDSVAFLEAASGRPISGSLRQIPPGAAEIRVNLTLGESADIDASVEFA